MFKIQHGKSKPLQYLAKEFYKRINPLKATNSLKKNSIKKRITKKIRIEKDIQRKAFYIMLARGKFKFLEEIITSNTNQLQLIQNKIETLVVAKIIPEFFTLKKGKPVSTDFGIDVLELFDYKSCRKNNKLYTLADDLDIVTCPYCNETRIMKIKSKKKKLMLFEFDHFIPKVISPYFSLSFYNLIPSCHTCNSTLKGSEIFSLLDNIHPYAEDLHSVVYFSTDKQVSRNDPDSFDVEIKYKTSDAETIKRADNNISTFAIQQRYNEYKDEILRLNEIKDLYPESKKLESLNKDFLGEIFSTREDLILRIANLYDIPVNEKAAMRKEKGKFKLDFAKEFKIID